MSICIVVDMSLPRKLRVWYFSLFFLVHRISMANHCFFLHNEFLLSLGKKNTASSHTNISFTISVTGGWLPNLTSGYICGEAHAVLERILWKYSRAGLSKVKDRCPTAQQCERWFLVISAFWWNLGLYNPYAVILPVFESFLNFCQSNVTRMFALAN